MTQPRDGQTGGWGLWVVATLADDFGVTAHSVGKTVWCAFKAGQACVPPVH